MPPLSSPRKPWRKSLPATGAETLCLDSDWGEISTAPDTAPASTVEAEDLAYIIYTSGSTGKPKGVEIPHRALANFLVSMAQEPGLAREDKLLAVTTLSFDIAGLELYLPAIVGGQVVIATREEASDGKLLAAAIAEHDISVMQATPASWRLLLEADWPGSQSLRVFCGGEALSRYLAEQLLPPLPPAVEPLRSDRDHYLVNRVRDSIRQRPGIHRPRHPQYQPASIGRRLATGT